MSETDTYTEAKVLIAGEYVWAVTVTYDTETGDVTDTDKEPVLKVTRDE